MAVLNFNFDLIDDILTLPLEDQLRIAKGSKIGSISPLVEFAYRFYDYPGRFVELWPEIEAVNYLASAMKAENLNSAANSNSSWAGSCEFIPTPRTVDEIDHPKWTSYLIRAKKAAVDAGMSPPFALALVGTLEEMVENVIWHSQNSSTGVSGYSASTSRFEYIVADAGIGVLSSLRGNPKFASIDSSVDALELALRSGVTRFETEPNRGNGFNNLVRNIAKSSCNLRFRSGDGCICFDGIAPQLFNKLSQSNRHLAQHRGFSISLTWEV